MDEALKRTFLKRTSLFEVWKNKTMRPSSVFKHVMDNLSKERSFSDNEQAAVKQATDRCCSEFKTKWRQCNRTLDKFKTKNTEWLNKDISFPKQLLKKVQASTSVKGRPQKSFCDGSFKTKRRRVDSIVQAANNVSPEELMFATRISLSSKGKRSVASLIKEAEKSPKRATAIKKAYLSPTPLPKKVAPEEALAVFVDTKLTKKQYCVIRDLNKVHKSDIFPSYKILLEAKKKCYPDSQYLKIIDTCAEINLQALLDHTIQRLIQAQASKLREASVGVDISALHLIVKWGCDGSSGLSRYKQKFSGEGSSSSSDDSSLFIISLVPLQLNTTINNEKVILWQNPRTSSTKYCRPIKILYEKETTSLIKDQVKDIENQILQLSPTSVSFEGQKLMVTTQMLLTMIDGKVCNALTDTHSQKCYICKASPKEMNDLTRVFAKTPDVTTYQFGLSVLHLWIRSFEFLLHLGYKLETKTWKTRKDNKALVEARKKYIQNRFRNELGLLVDIPKPGFGTTNDGNTARRFFANCDISSAITGVSKELINRFSVILRTVACGFDIKVDAFEQYCRDTAQLYVDLYPWYCMPPTIHKLLIHSPEIIKYAVLPIGQLSEEAQEARNKDCKRYRELNTRKFSRRNTIEDLLHMLLISSDPLISSLRKDQTIKKFVFNKEIRDLLSDSAIKQKSETDSESEGSIANNSDTDTDSNDSNSEKSIEEQEEED